MLSKQLHVTLLVLRKESGYSTGFLVRNNMVRLDQKARSLIVAWSCCGWKAKKIQRKLLRDNIPHQKVSAVTISSSITQHRYVSQSDGLDNTCKFPNPQIRDLTGKSTPPDPLIRFEDKSTAKRSGIRHSTIPESFVTI